MRKLLLLAVLASCGSDDSPTDASVTKDAAKTADAKATVDGATTPDAAPAATVQTVDCATVTPAGTVTTIGGSGIGASYSPMATTITANGVVKFVMPATHNVIPDTSTTTDTGLHVDFNATTCLKFTATGTFGFKCQPHNFKGSVTVN